MATAKSQRVHSGHTIYIKIGANAIGRISGLEADRAWGTEGVYEIGSNMPQEHVQNRFEGTLNVERFFVKDNELRKAGLGGMGIEVLRKKPIDIEVVDKYTDKVIRVYCGCTLGTCREVFRVNAIAGENATFSYLYAKDAYTIEQSLSVIDNATVHGSGNTAGSTANFAKSNDKTLPEVFYE